MIRPGESSADTLLNHRGIQRVPSDRIELFQLREFIDGDLRTELIRLIEQARSPSTVSNTHLTLPTTPYV